MKVVYEDNHLIAINKACGEIVQGDKTGDAPLSDNVKLYLKEKYDKAGNVFAGVIHRLDRPVSGLVVLAKTSKALSRMNQLFKLGEIDKTYWAVVKGRPPENEALLDHYLVRNEKQNKSYAHAAPKEGSKQAKLKYKVMASSDMYSLLEVKLLTGRHHQIRCQLAAIGSPIKGDMKYGFPRSNDFSGIHLHAWSIAFVHPVKNEPVFIDALPDVSDKLWNICVAVKQQ
ncbi:MAG: RNA pseudouridine synthase [Bacteroidales bacterium]|nr:RNA pseudouridine synthase [Bacteroidales bacterium]